jgi:hypothetical protein
MPSAPATGGAGTINVDTTRDCTWLASSGAPWIAITGGASGQGEGSVAFRVSENTVPSARRGMVTVNDAQIAISQDAAPCKFTLSPASVSVPATGGSATVHVDALAGCTWNATSQTGWAQITSGSSGSGAGNVTIAVGANVGNARSGAVTIAGQSIAVSQSAVACDATLSATAFDVLSQGAVETVAVTIPGSCQWTAATSVDWITVTTGRTGTGSAQVQFSIAANASPARRQGAVTIAGQSIAVTQAGAPCTYAIGAPTRAVDQNAGSGSVAVTSLSGCTWTAASTTSWITVTGGANGNGNGTVNYSFAANTGPARTGTVTIAGQTFTLSQANGCSPSISATSQIVSQGGGTGSIAVTVTAGCTWTATTGNPDWLTITSGTSGNGNGTVAFNAAANTGPGRTGTLTIAGQVVTVAQGTGCSYGITPTAQNFDTPGGTGSVSVSAAAGCSWTAASNNPDWIVITGGAPGSGNGAVSFNVAANSGPARTGTLTIAGQVFTINQAALPCTYSISPSGQFFDVSGGSGTVTLTTPGYCTWTASSTVEWMTVTSATSGTGSSTITFGVFSNFGTPRTGTLSIGGQSFTVNQAGTQ